jgi:hypothetical protein
MKKHHTFSMTAVVLGLIINHSAAFSKKIDQKEIQQNYTEVIILDKGIKRTLYIQKENNNTQESSKNKMGIYSTKMQESKNGLIISFTDPSKINIDEFEIQYGLKLKKKLNIGYYIFENVSENSDMQIVSTIISNEKSVKTVKPNWKKKNQPR